MQKFDCAIIGDVLVDIIVPLKNDYLSRGGTTYCNQTKTVPGGAGNVAVALSLLGLEVALVGKVGNDSYGELYKNDLTSHRVFSKIFVDPESSTGTAVILVHKNKERSFLVFRGANDNLTSEDLEKASEIILNSSYLYFAGYSLVKDPQRASILETVSTAKRNGIKTVFDPGAYNIIDSNRRLFTEILNSCDVVSLNVKEASVLTQTGNLKLMISRLRREDLLTILKRGKKGCIIITDRETFEVPSFQARFIDSTGAGDAFMAGVIYGLIKKYPLPRIGNIANLLAAQAVSQIGARFSLSKRNIRSITKG